MDSSMKKLINITSEELDAMVEAGSKNIERIRALGPDPNDESLLGLLLRAHREASAQSHGEEYVFNNIPAMCDYDMAVQSIEAAIKSVHFAQIKAYGQKDRKETA